MCSTIISFSQVSFIITEPASISGGYEFTSNGDAPNWGLANLNDPLDAIFDTVVVAEDGTPGINVQGVPHSNEACQALTNNVAGKIVLVYRYDGQSTNDCYASTKVLNAQNAGAVGVIIVNRQDGVFGYNGNPDGMTTNIPFAFIDKDDGAIIRDKIDNGETVVAFLGNKLGFYTDDVGIKKNNTLVPTETCTPALTSLNTSEFGFDVGTMIYNYGSDPQNNVMLTAEVTGPAGVWTETAGPFTIASGDSIDVFTGGTNNIPAFSFSNYPNGNYNMTYSIDIGTTDEMSFDNSMNYTFVVSDTLASFCDMDTLTGLPHRNQFARSTEPAYSSCMVYHNPNGSRLGATGMYTLATMAWDTQNPLEGNFVTTYLYQWDDSFVDLLDPNFGFNSLIPLTEGDYTFGANDDSSFVFVEFNDPIQLNDNQRYLACIEVWSDEIWLGHNNRIDYNRNTTTHYYQPLVPSSANGVYYWAGFGTDLTPNLALRVFDAAELGVEDDKILTSHIYPNPANSELNVVIDGFESGQMIILDLSGRVIIQQKVSGSKNTVNVSNLAPGQYVIKIIGQNEMTSTKRFTKL